jgi:hypothetical protein
MAFAIARSLPIVLYARGAGTYLSGDWATLVLQPHIYHLNRHDIVEIPVP